MENVIFFILGAAISWATQHFYYRRSDKKKPEWFNVESIKGILAKNPEDIDWTAEQILNLYKHRVYSSDPSDPLPYNICPNCGSAELERGSYNDDQRDETYFVINCKSCKWSNWTQ